MGDATRRERLEAQFIQFWSVWPSWRKEGKKPAFEQFLKIGPTEELFASMLAALEWQIPMWQARGRRELTPMPVTWFRQARWEDERPSQDDRGVMCPHTPMCANLRVCTLKKLGRES